jgi:hypothetical protein
MVRKTLTTYTLPRPERFRFGGFILKPGPWATCWTKASGH